MIVNQYEENSILIFELEGKMLGGPDTNQLYENIYKELDSGRKHFIINLAKVKWINSSGLGILINIFNVVKQKKSKLILVSESDQVKKMLKITRLDKILSLEKDIEAAKSALLSD